MVASALETRLRRLLGSPLEFWPFHKGIAPDERAMRAARMTFYLGIVYAHGQGRAEALLLPAAAAMTIVLLFGGIVSVPAALAAFRASRTYSAVQRSSISATVVAAVAGLVAGVVATLCGVLLVIQARGLAERRRVRAQAGLVDGA